MKKRKKNWFRISSTEDEHWNLFTWVVLISLFIVYGSISEFLFGVWTKALYLTGFGAMAMGTGGHTSFRTGGGASLVWVSLCLLIPMVMSGLPAIATLLGLSTLLNPRRKDFED